MDAEASKAFKISRYFGKSKRILNERRQKVSNTFLVNENYNGYY
jgi:hypothetical protein